MKHKPSPAVRDGRDELNNHERNKKLKGERDRRLRKALSHPRYADQGDSWER